MRLSTHRIFIIRVDYQSPIVNIVSQDEREFTGKYSDERTTLHIVAASPDIALSHAKNLFVHSGAKDFTVTLEKTQKLDALLLSIE